MVVNGDGSQTRDFVYIDDVVEALVAAGTAAGVNGQIVNVGSGEETSINELVAQIGAILKTKPNMLYNHEAAGGIARLVANLGKARQLLRFKPRVRLEAGLRNLLAHDPIFRRHARAQDVMPAEVDLSTSGEV